MYRDGRNAIVSARWPQDPPEYSEPQQCTCCEAPSMGLPAVGQQAARRLAAAKPPHAPLPSGLSRGRDAGACAPHRCLAPKTSSGAHGSTPTTRCRHRQEMTCSRTRLTALQAQQASDVGCGCMQAACCTVSMPGVRTMQGPVPPPVRRAISSTQAEWQAQLQLGPPGLTAKPNRM